MFSQATDWHIILRLLFVNTLMVWFSIFLTRQQCLPIDIGDKIRDPVRVTCLNSSRIGVPSGYITYYLSSAQLMEFVRPL